MSLSRRVIAVAAFALVGRGASAQERIALPASLDPQTRQIIERLGDSVRNAGLPVEPLYAKAAEGKLKQASDAQILNAVRLLAKRFGEIRVALGAVDVASYSASATALSAGVPIAAIRQLHDAAGAGRDAGMDFSTALVTLTDLVGQHVTQSSAVGAVQALLARKAAPDQYARLRLDVTDDIVAGRSPDQSVRARTDAIVRTLPAAPPPLGPIKPPFID